MKATEWQAYLSRQHQCHKKRLYTVSELANIAGKSRHAVNNELSRLQQQGILQRYAFGIHGIPGAGTWPELLMMIDPTAYVTGFSALFIQGFITQAPQVVTCFTRRHLHRSRMQTAIGEFHFHTVSQPIYSYPSSDNLAKPEQAICDLYYHAIRKRIRPESVYTIRNVEWLDEEILAKNLSRYPVRVQNAVRDLVNRTKA